MLVGKGPFGTPVRRRKDNIKIDLKEIWCEDMDWIKLPQTGGGLL
jgi:hypothetical protein